ncbi:DUF192 domain-containing protein [Sphingobium mellinum]|uniref:DUF192 domain-containing protein n=1 Tax=Sphingobium mellinum TaxID=1387166 RepID=UPI0030EBDA40
MTRLTILCLALLGACSQPAPKAEEAVRATAQTFTRVPLAIHTSSGTQRFTVEVAQTAQEQERGLMFRKSLDPRGGMLFPMNPPRTASFWMKDTLIPLDMVFVRTDGTIAFIAANTMPYSREPISAGVPVSAVLELAGGRAAAIGAKEGDTVEWGECAGDAGTPPANRDFCPPTTR